MNNANYKKPADIVALFKKILKEASKFHGKPPHALSEGEFKLVSQGRLGATAMSKLGGFAKLRNYVSPGPDKQVDDQTKALLKRILAQ